MAICNSRGGGRDERGAALVEFALILPIFMMLVLGMFSGGIAYSTKLSINGASREGSRYGATLPIDTASISCGGSAGMTAWLNCVADVTEQAASGDLDSDQEGRYICVAYVHPSGASPNPATTRLTITGTGAPVIATGSTCYTDGLPNDTRRVQVRATRVEKLEALLYSRDLTLTSDSTTRFEATTS